MYTVINNRNNYTSLMEWQITNNTNNRIKRYVNHKIK